MVGVALLLGIGLGLAGWRLWQVYSAGGRVPGGRRALAARSIMTAREQAVFQMLVALHPDHVVLAHVPLSRLIEVRGAAGRGRESRGALSRMVADFVLCTKDFSIVAVIGLDGAGRSTEARKRSAVTAAGLRWVRIDEGPLPDPAELRRRLELGDGPVAPAAAPPGFVGGRPVWRYAATAAVLVAAAIGFAVLGGHSVGSRVNLAPATQAAAVPPAPAPTESRTAAPPAAVTLAEIPLADDPQQTQQTREAAAKAAVAQQAAAAEEKRRERAWQQFFKPDDSCEHPADWAEQVECGNQYIRARKAFDKLWRLQKDRPAAFDAVGQNRLP